MAKGLRAKKRQSLAEILASVSDALFPEQLGEARVLVDSTDCYGDTPLHILVRRGDRYAVGLLLENGANPNAVGDMGETPLHVAVSEGDHVIVEKLVQSGAKSTVVSEFGDTPAERCPEEDKELAKLLAKAI
ncbi:MAG: ankyrin repeat domain-containing protein [Pseudomonadota bacterium]